MWHWSLFSLQTFWVNQDFEMTLREKLNLSHTNKESQFMFWKEEQQTRFLEEGRMLNTHLNQVQVVACSLVGDFCVSLLVEFVGEDRFGQYKLQRTRAFWSTTWCWLYNLSCHMFLMYTGKQRNKREDEGEGSHDNVSAIREAVTMEENHYSALLV